MDNLQELAESLVSLSAEDLGKLADYLQSHEGNTNKVGLTTDGDPVPPNPTHP